MRPFGWILRGRNPVAIINRSYLISSRSQDFFGPEHWTYFAFLSISCLILIICLFSFRLIAVEDEIKLTEGEEVTLEYGTWAKRFDINVLRQVLTSVHQNAHANAKKWIFDIQYPGNRFEFGIVSNDFWSSTIWAI